MPDCCDSLVAAALARVGAVRCSKFLEKLYELSFEGEKQTQIIYSICANNDFNEKAALNDIACDIVGYASPVAITNTENTGDGFPLIGEYSANV